MKKILDVCCTNKLDFNFDHFKDINELLENIDIWFINDDIDYTRWFGLNDLHTLKVYITKLQNENKKLKEDIRKDKVQFETFELAEECDKRQDIIDIYKTKIDKALEFIRKVDFMQIGYMNFCSRLEEILEWGGKE